MARRRIQLKFVGQGTHEFFLAAKLETPVSDQELLDASRLNLRGWVVPTGTDVVSIVVRSEVGEVRSELNVDREDVGAVFETDSAVPRFGFDIEHAVESRVRLVSISIATASDEWPWVEISLAKEPSEKSSARPKGAKKRGALAGGRARSSKAAGKA
ncbi:hypothetical protein [Brevundimonas sp.]|uniref:hypothetical protein n=1 Tax=Brevundimonas sp. TaxID=1871086 RepID=UPI001ACC1FB3|nr:hypothetical protein [Brevundimonas sp.]MBN9464675.1 hypothetical protein [Brevundimonas sp.]